MSTRFLSHFLLIFLRFNWTILCCIFLFSFWIVFSNLFKHYFFIFLNHYWLHFWNSIISCRHHRFRFLLFTLNSFHFHAHIIRATNIKINRNHFIFFWWISKRLDWIWHFKSRRFLFFGFVEFIITIVIIFSILALAQYWQILPHFSFTIFILFLKLYNNI